MLLYILLAALPAIIVLGIVWVIIKMWLVKRREKTLGYRVEFVTPYRLEAEPDEFALVYHQDGKQVLFKGKVVNKEHILNLDIPEGPGYKDSDPQGINRELMKARILTESKRLKIRITQ